MWNRLRPRVHPRDFRSVLLLWSLLVLFYAPAISAWASGGWAFNDDAPGLFAPWRAFAGEEIRAGRWPLWNPYLFGGLPFALNGQAALGYAPNVLFLAVPFKSALLLDAIAHSLLLASGGYFLGRAVGLSRSASWLLGLCLGANGAVSSHVYGGHVTWHAARAWLPWMAWALVRGLQTQRARFAYLWAVLFFFQFAAGYPPLALASVGLCAVAFLVRLARGRIAPREGEEGEAGALRSWWWAMVACGLGAGLVMSLALPLREVSGLSVHGSGLAWEEASELSGSWKSLARWVAPGAFNMARPMQWSIRYGAHEEASAVGILPLILALGAPLWAHKLGSTRDKIYLGALWIGMAVCVVLAMGANTPVYRALFDHIGLFRVLRFPVRWLEIWAILACISAAWSFDLWRRASPGAAPKYLAAASRSLGWASGAAGAMSAGAVGVWAWAWSQSASEFWNPLALSLEASRAPEDRLRFAPLLRSVALGECAGAALACAAVATVLFLTRRSLQMRHSARWWLVLLALPTVELGALFVRSARTWIEPRNRTARSSIPPQIAARFQKGHRWVTRVDWRGMNSAMASRVELLNGYDAMNTRAFWSLAQAIEGRSYWIDMYQPLRSGAALRIGGVTHALAPERSPLAPPGSHARALVEARVGDVFLRRLYADRDVWPRLFLSRRVAFAPESKTSAALGQMAQISSPRPGQDWPLLLLKESRSTSELMPLSTWGERSSSGRVLRWSARPNVLTGEVEARQKCWLGISQAWSPSWQAWVNGKRVPLARANGPFCALQVERGRSKIELVYAPQSWRLASFVGLCALAILGAGLGAFRERCKYLSAAST